MNRLKTILNLFLTTMYIFIVQKIYFLIFTWHSGTTFADVFDVMCHGLRLDLAVTGYTLVLPLVMSFFLCLIPRCSASFRPTLRVYYAVISLLTAIIITADAALYPFWQFKLDSSVFLYTDKPADAMASVSLWFILLQLLSVIVWTIVSYWLYRRCLTANVTKHTSRYAALALHIAAIAFTALIIRGGVGQGTNNVSVAYYSDNQYLNHAAVNPVFNLLYSMGKQEDFSSKYQFYDENQRAGIMRGIYDQHPTSATPQFLNTQRPDIILIVWEGCCEAMFSSDDVTPNLNRIAKEGISFSNCYANSYRTDRGLVCLTAGYLGLPDASLMKIPEKNEHLPALPRTLASNGYATTFWYGGDITFTNMGGYMRQAGFSRIVSDKNFTAKERTAEWGVPDEIMFKKIADEYLTPPQPSMVFTPPSYSPVSRGTETPQGREYSPSTNSPSQGAGRSFHTIMTLSSHEPWDVPTHRLKDEITNAFNYTDECIGRFIDTLKQSPRWQNTLIIITADHGVMSCDTDTRYCRRVVHIPMVWTGGAVRQPMVIDKLMNQSDLAATLLGQLGIGYDDFTFSRDVLNASYTYPTATHSYNNGVSFIDSTGVTTYDNDAQRVIVGPDHKRERKAKATLQTLYKTVGNL